MRSRPGGVSLEGDGARAHGCASYEGGTLPRFTLTPPRRPGPGCCVVACSNAHPHLDEGAPLQRRPRLPTRYGSGGSAPRRVLRSSPGEVSERYSWRRTERAHPRGGGVNGSSGNYNFRGVRGTPPPQRVCLGRIPTSREAALPGRRAISPPIAWRCPHVVEAQTADLSAVVRFLARRTVLSVTPISGRTSRSVPFRDLEGDAFVPTWPSIRCRRTRAPQRRPHRDARRLRTGVSHAHLDRVVVRRGGVSYTSPRGAHPMEEIQWLLSIMRRH